MLSADRAAELAARACSHRVDSERMREIAAGWYFPYLWAEGEEPLVGSNGIIINKQTGAAFVLGSAFPVERDLALYDKGYQYQSYDLVVLGFRSIDAAVSALVELRLAQAEPEYESGVVWRIRRPLTREEIRASLERLPAVFANVPLYFVLEPLEEARRDETVRVDVLESGARKADTAASTTS